MAMGGEEGKRKRTGSVDAHHGGAHGLHALEVAVDLREPVARVAAVGALERVAEAHEARELVGGTPPILAGARRRDRAEPVKVESRAKILDARCAV